MASFLPSSSNLMSFAAWIPSSFRFFSICLLRAREALSSALMAQPMMIACSGVRRASLLETAPQPRAHHHKVLTTNGPPTSRRSGPALDRFEPRWRCWPPPEPEVSATLAPDHSSRRHPTHSAGERQQQQQQQRDWKAAGIDVRGGSRRMVAPPPPPQRVASLLPPTHQNTTTTTFTTTTTTTR